MKVEKITHAFHDVDGTHSLIRQWEPVMSIVLNNVIDNGLDRADDANEVTRLINLSGTAILPETDRFCVESAGLSALTQMEWAIRRAIENDVITPDCDTSRNSEIIEKIWQGFEVFDDYNESPVLTEFLKENTPKLFLQYEKVLNGACRDKNLESARKNPDEWLVKGSKGFMRMLKDKGVKNYFVTGAVIEKGKGMWEEIEALGFEIGRDKLVEDVLGSTWTEKIPKNIVMKRLCEKMQIDGKCVLVVGDGRSEISAGVGLGAFTVSRLNKTAKRQRELHMQLGTNMIIEDFTDPLLIEHVSTLKQSGG